MNPTFTVVVVTPGALAVFAGEPLVVAEPSLVFAALVVPDELFELLPQPAATSAEIATAPSNTLPRVTRLPLT
jgi:hypothetical protein